MATITKRQRKHGTKYRVEVRVKGHPPISETFDRLSEAVRWGEDAEAAIRAGGYVGAAAPGDMPFSAAAKKYALEVLPGKKISTRIREQFAIDHLLAFFQGTVREITIDQIAAYKESRAKKVQPATILRELNVLSDLLERARVEWKLDLTGNAVKDYPYKPRKPGGRLRYLTEIEARMLLDVCRESENRMLYPFVLLMLHSGLRPSEAAGLTWDRLDLPNRAISLDIVDTKTGQRRLAPVSIMAAEALAKIPRQGEYVFLPDGLSDDVRRRPNTFFRRCYATALAHCGLENVTMHDLRHTAASHLVMAGVDLRTVAEILGHKSMNMTMRYSHLSIGHTKAAVEKIGGFGL